MICNKFIAKMKEAAKKFDSLASKNVEAALAVTKRLKVVVDSETATMLTEIIPTDVDKAILGVLRVAISSTFNALLAYDECKNEPSLEAKYQCIVKKLKSVPDDQRDAMLHKVSALIAKHLDKRYSQKWYDLFTQSVYVAG